MPERVSISLEGYAHENPVPVASRIGPFLFSGVITGRDPLTKEMPDSLEEQCSNVFVHVRELMAAAGSSPDAIVKMTFHLVRYRDRNALNREWLTQFPDPTSRPARQVMAAVLDGTALVHCDIVAVMSDHI